MMFTLRPAEETDAEAVARVHVDSWRWAYRDTLPPSSLASLSVERRRTQTSDMLRSGKGRILLANDAGGGVLGFCSFGPARDLPLPWSEIYALYLVEFAVGHGIGRALVETSVNALRASGFSRAALWVLEGNTRGRRFYERLGWRNDEVRRSGHIGGAATEEIRYSYDFGDPAGFGVPASASR